MATFADIINSDQSVLVDFYADWCGSCKMMTPILAELSGELKEKAKVLKVDVDKNQKASNVYKIKSIPTMILFKKGKILWRYAGTAGKEQLRVTIEQNI